MKNIFLLLFTFIFVQSSYADQYEIISEEMAIEAVELLNNQSDVIVWCDCCDGENLLYVTVNSAYYEYTGENGESTVFLSGFDEYGNEYLEALDLAYVYVADGELAVKVSEFLGYETEVCTEYFSYYDNYPFMESNDLDYSDDEVTFDLGSDESEGDVYQDVVSITSFFCMDYCHLYFIDSEGMESSGIIDESSLPENFLLYSEEEEAYYMNPIYEGMSANIEYSTIEVEDEFGQIEYDIFISNLEIQ
jgi:hypothetical protein